MDKTSFGHRIPEIKTLLQDRKVKASVSTMFSNVLEHLGVGKEKRLKVITECLNLASNYGHLHDYERKARDILQQAGVVEAIPQKLGTRSGIIVDQIKPHLLEGKILDLGCGDGVIGKLLSEEGYEVVLSDVYEPPKIGSHGLQFRQFKQGERVPSEDEKFDNTLVITVFHHSDDPIKTLQEAKRVTRKGGRILVTESVFGVDGKTLSQEERRKAEPFLKLTHEQQRLSNVFFDHFYNRILHYSEKPETKVNVPFNFNTPEGWRKLFEKHGLVEEKAIHLGLDLPSVPEYHTLHVLRVK